MEGPKHLLVHVIGHRRLSVRHIRILALSTYQDTCNRESSEDIPQAPKPLREATNTVAKAHMRPRGRPSCPRSRAHTTLGHYGGGGVGGGGGNRHRSIRQNHNYAGGGGGGGDINRFDNANTITVNNNTHTTAVLERYDDYMSLRCFAATTMPATQVCTRPRRVAHNTHTHTPHARAHTHTHTHTHTDTPIWLATECPTQLSPRASLATVTNTPRPHTHTHTATLACGMSVAKDHN